MGQVRCGPTSPLLARPQRAKPQPSRRRGALGFLAGRQRPPPPSSPARAPGLRGPGATYRACKPENRQRKSSSFGAMVRWSLGSSVQGLRPGAASSGARASPPPALLSLPASRAADCSATPAPGLRGRTGVGSSGPPRPRRPAGLRAAPRGARGTPGHRGAPPPARSRAPGPRSLVAGAGGRELSLALQPRGWPRRCPLRRELRASAPAVGSARGVRPPCAGRWGQRGGRSSGRACEAVPAGRSFPNYTPDNARGEESKVWMDSRVWGREGGGTQRGRGGLGIPQGAFRRIPGFSTSLLQS